ncbi:signal peptide peptidase SppA [Anaplasmataceae bacterium AB001_6]|nr:signal peptide peptidase SppA [Anaplasmataceae bacterium AB001_6]
MFDVNKIIDEDQSSYSLYKWKSFAVLLIIMTLLMLYSFFFKKNEDVEDKLQDIKEPIIAKIRIEGVMYRDKYRTDIISSMATDENIKALVILINSPGGELASIDPLYRAINSVSKVKPVVIVMEDIATSAAYMVSLAGEYIFAMRSTMTGSIGVLLETYEFSDLAKKIGINFTTYTSGKYKGFPSSTRSTPEDVADVIVKNLECYHRYMIETVANRRTIPIEKAEELSGGQAFLGIQALDNNLIDGIGYEEDALKWLKEEKEIDILSVKYINVMKHNKAKNMSNSGIIKRVIGMLSDFDSDDLSNSQKIGLYSILKI